MTGASAGVSAVHAAGAGAAFAAGMVGGRGAGGLASAVSQTAGTVANVAIAGALAGPAAAAAAAVSGLATVAQTAATSLKDMAAAASPNGLKGLEQAGQLLSATLGTVLVPAFTMLAAGVITAADKLAKDLAPNLAAVAQWYRESIPYFVAFAETVVTATKALVAFVDAVTFGQTGRSVGGAVLNAATFGLVGGSDDKDTTDEFDKNLQALIKDMQASMGGGKGVGSIEGAWKKAQEAAFGGAIEQKFLRKFQEVINMLGRIANKREDQPLRK